VGGSSTTACCSPEAPATSGCGYGQTTRCKPRGGSTCPAGFRLTAERAHHSFGVDLVGQTYELDLDEPTSEAIGTPREHDTGVES